MSHIEYMAIERFVTSLKRNFPLIANPKDFADRIMNISYEHIHKLIDLQLEQAMWEFDREAEKEAVANDNR